MFHVSDCNSPTIIYFPSVSIHNVWRHRLSTVRVLRGRMYCHKTRVYTFKVARCGCMRRRVGADTPLPLCREGHWPSRCEQLIWGHRCECYYNKCWIVIIVFALVLDFVHCSICFLRIRIQRYACEEVILIYNFSIAYCINMNFKCHIYVLRIANYYVYSSEIGIFFRCEGLNSIHVYGDNSFTHQRVIFSDHRSEQSCFCS